MIFTGTGKIWDQRRKGILCTFSPNGILDTDDEYVINRLHELGYIEADKADMVSIEICNSVHVDWRDRYEAAKEELRIIRSEHTALKRAYAEVEKKLNDIEESMDIPVAVESSEEAVAEIQSDNYDVDGELLPKNFPELHGMKLKAFLARHGYEMKAIRVLTKDEAVAAVYKLLTKKGLVD